MYNRVVCRGKNHERMKNMSNFDYLINRRQTNSVKWDKLKELYGKDDLIPLWIADMDFSVSPAIVKALKKRMEHQIYGYSDCSDRYYESVINWMSRRHDWQIEKEWIVYAPGVVPALSYSIRAFTEPGDNIIIQSPVYHPFYSTIESNGRNVVTNPLIYKDGKYYMDYVDLERKIDSKTRMLILCSPHNPVGRVWTKEELLRLGEICIKNDIILVSDEIHFDLVYRGHKHTVMASISPEIADRCIVLTSPSKTFNIAGLQIANAIISNESLRERYIRELEKDHIVRPNIFGERALIAAYDQSEDWLEDLLDYLEENKNFFIEYMHKNISQLKVVKPEGTYLLWVDCSGLGMNWEDLRKFFIEKCGLALNDGAMFGEEGRFFQRFNIACPRWVLEEALKKIDEAVNSKLK